MKIPAPQSAGIFYCRNGTRLTATARLDDHVAVRQTGLDADDAAVGVMAVPTFVTASIVMSAHDNTVTAFADHNFRRSRQCADNGSGNNGTQNKNFHFNLQCSSRVEKKRRRAQLVQLFQIVTCARNEQAFIAIHVPTAV
jgi:hypothetical protein